MSMISEQVKQLREIAEERVNSRLVQNAMLQAADTIEALSAKLSAANMERYQKGIQTIEPLTEISKTKEEIDYENNLYRVWYIPKYHQLSISRKDGLRVESWYDIWNIKNQIFGDDVKAVEIYPTCNELIDGQNQRHLFVFEINEKISFENAYEMLNRKNNVSANMERSERYYGDGWISCKDRLPIGEEYKKIIDGEPYYKNLLASTNEECVPICIGWYDQENESWFDIDGFSFNPVAWCELPSPYK